MIIAFAPKHNSPDKKDATGAFLPEARSFLEQHEVRSAGRLVIVDNHGTPLAMRKAQLAPLGEEAKSVRCVALFCHGWRTGLQLGWTLANHATLGAAIAGAITENAAITLYACDAGRDDDRDREDDLHDGPGGEGGFADVLRDSIVRLRPDWRGWVDAHTTAAHTTKNPDVRRFDSGGGSAYIVSRESPRWKRWREALREGSLRHRFPFLTRDEVHAELGA